MRRNKEKETSNYNTVVACEFKIFQEICAQYLH